MMLAAGVAAIWLGGGSLYRGLSGVLRNGLAFDQRVPLDPGVMMEQAVQGFGQALMTLLPIFGLLAVIAVLSSVVLGGIVISGKPATICPSSARSPASSAGATTTTCWASCTWCLRR